MVTTPRRKTGNRRKRPTTGSRRGALVRSVRPVGMTLLAVLASAACILVHDLVTQCAYFEAQRIAVYGNRRLGVAQIRAQGRLTPGMNILAVNLPLTRKRLLAHPWIAAAQVRRRIPDTLIVTVREQQAVAVVDLGRRFLLNAAGQIFKEWRPGDPDDVPLVQGLSFADLPVAGAAASEAFDAVMTVLRLSATPGSDVPLQAVRSIQVDRDMGVTLHLNGDITQVRLGFAAFERKFRRLAQLRGYLATRGVPGAVRGVDLHDLHRVVVFPGDGATVAHRDKEV